MILKALVLLAALGVIRGPHEDQPYTITHTSGSVFTTVDISSGVTMDAINVYGYRFITFEMDFVHNSASAVTMTCTESDASGGTYRNIHALQMSGYTAASDAIIWSNAVSGNESWTWTVTLNGYKFLKCTWTAVGGAASDTLTVDAVVGD